MNFINIIKKIHSKFVTIVFILLVFMAINVLYVNISRIGNNRINNEESSLENTDTAVEETEQQADTTGETNLVEPISYTAQEEDQNAFELLKTVAEVEYKEYDFGVFIESINGIKGDDKYFWAFYINGEQATKGADQTILQKGDTAEWHYTSEYK